MSAPNAGRQSPDPERQTGAQQQDVPSQSGSGKVWLFPSQLRPTNTIRTGSNQTASLETDLQTIQTQTLTLGSRWTIPKERTKARRTRLLALRVTQPTSWPNQLRQKLPKAEDFL